MWLREISTFAIWFNGGNVRDCPARENSWFPVLVSQVKNLVILEKKKKHDCRMKWLASKPGARSSVPANSQNCNKRFNKPPSPFSSFPSPSKTTKQYQSRQEKKKQANLAFSFALRVILPKEAILPQGRGVWSHSLHQGATSKCRCEQQILLE